MASLEDVKRQADDIPAFRHKGTKVGSCSRCRDFGGLTKAIWNDPYTDEDGWGWLCETCVKQTEKLQHKYTPNIVNQGNSLDLSKSFHPVPKPQKKEKKGH